MNPSTSTYMQGYYLPITHSQSTHSINHSSSTLLYSTNHLPPSLPPSLQDGPSARSGHRMVVWRNCILLFGGFYEALREVRWYSDLYLFSFTERKWMQVPPKPYVQGKREGRVMCSLFIFTFLVLFSCLISYHVYLASISSMPSVSCLSCPSCLAHSASSSQRLPHDRAPH
jgi:hypothetical protein